VPPGNPLRVERLEDIARPGLRFINRQPGSGTRVWLDAELERVGIAPEGIQGYGLEKSTHSEVAQAVAEGETDVGLGLETAAAAFRLDFVFLVQEPYDLVAPAESLARGPLRLLADWLATETAQHRLGGLVGYDTRSTGAIVWD